jgi:hypothetical protein
MSLATGIQLLHEALSRARTPRPQNLHSEATHRSARAIAIRARREQTLRLGR